MEWFTWRSFLLGLSFGFIVGLAFSNQARIVGPVDMPYALISWRAPADATDDELTAIENTLDEFDVIHFFQGLALVDDDFPDWSSLRTRLEEEVLQHPGMEAVLIIPGKGVRVGGWVDALPSDADLERAQELMNQSGRDTYPVLDSDS